MFRRCLDLKWTEDSASKATFRRTDNPCTSVSVGPRRAQRLHNVHSVSTRSPLLHHYWRSSPFSSTQQSSKTSLLSCWSHLVPYGEMTIHCFPPQDRSLGSVPGPTITKPVFSSLPLCPTVSPLRQTSHKKAPSISWRHHAVLCFQICGAVSLLLVEAEDWAIKCQASAERGTV